MTIRTGRGEVWRLTVAAALARGGVECVTISGRDVRVLGDGRYAIVQHVSDDGRVLSSRRTGGMALRQTLQGWSVDGGAAVILHPSGYREYCGGPRGMSLLRAALRVAQDARSSAPSAAGGAS